VAGGLAFVSDQLGIVELSHVCADMRARNLELFERLGAWVPATADGALQRLFAEACHRHAWHAELWQRRMPAIPIGVHAERPASAARELVGDGPRHQHYRQALTELRDRLAALRPRVDPVLDPSTARTIDLVAGDLDDLTRRLDGLPAA
jgi:hypothetical protein